MSEEQEDSLEISFICKYCLETFVRVFDNSYDEYGMLEWEYPDVCPHCRTTKCSECGGLLKLGSSFCVHCGKIAPEYMSNVVRTTSTSAAYAEYNWGEKVRRWNDKFGKLEDEKREWSMRIGVDGRTLKEHTIKDGEKKILNTHEFTDEEVDLIEERKDEIRNEYSELYDEEDELDENEQ